MLSLILEGILYAIAIMLFYLEAAMGKVLDMLYDMFKVFAGVSPIWSKGESSYLLDTIFGNDIIKTIYIGMALIGIAMTFGFAVAAVVKKSFDSTGEKVKATFGMILTNVFKAILLILLMTVIVSATIMATEVLLTQVDYLFNNAEALNDPATIEFDDEDYATMFRILDTVGNHSLNPSSNNRFNINSCFNEIRNDLVSLAQSRIFEYTYEEYPSSWQYSLRQIYLAADVNQDIPVDIYNEAVSTAMLDCMDTIRNDGSFKPLSSYTRPYTYADSNSDLGRTILVASSFSAAENNVYNEHPGLDDALRRPFYLGEKNVYSRGTVEDYFDISLGSWNHLVALVATAVMIIEFAKILLNCVARIFNIILLYVSAPGFISVMPLDDGGKMKQWTTAFVIQSLSIFGSYIAVRLMVIFIPIILSSDLILFTGNVQNIVAKILFIVGMCFTAEKASSMFSGILADNASYQSVLAGDVGSGLIRRGMSLGTRAFGTAARAGGAVAKTGLGAAATATGLSTLGKKIGGKFSNWGQAMRDKGGFFGAAKNGFTSNAQDSAARESEEKSRNAKEQRDFRSQVLSGLGSAGKGGSTGGHADNGSPRKKTTDSAAQVNHQPGSDGHVNHQPGSDGHVNHQPGSDGHVNHQPGSNTVQKEPSGSRPGNDTSEEKSYDPGTHINHQPGLNNGQNEQGNGSSEQPEHSGRIVNHQPELMPENVQQGTGPSGMISNEPDPANGTGGFGAEGAVNDYVATPGAFRLDPSKHVNRRPVTDHTERSQGQRTGGTVQQPAGPAVGQRTGGTVQQPLGHAPEQPVPQTGSRRAKTLPQRKK